MEKQKDKFKFNSSTAQNCCVSFTKDVGCCSNHPSHVKIEYKKYKCVVVFKPCIN